MRQTGQGLRERLAGLAASDDESLPLAATALAIAGLRRSKADMAHYLRHMDALANALTACGAASAEDRSAALAEVFFRGHGYQPDFAEDVGDWDPGLMAVIDGRRGGSEALGILALEATRRAGWVAEALAFSPRFLLRLEDSVGRRVIVDPMLEWRPVTPPDLRAALKAAKGLEAELSPGHYAPLANRGILVRFQNEMKMRLLRGGDVERALETVEDTLLFAPAEEALWREAGLMHIRLNRIPDAVAALQQFAARTSNPTARARTLRLLNELHGRLN